MFILYIEFGICVYYFVLKYYDVIIGVITVWCDMVWYVDSTRFQRVNKNKNQNNNIILRLQCERVKMIYM